MQISKRVSVIKFDPLSARRIDNTYYIGNKSDIVLNQVIDIHPAVAREKDISLINSVAVYDTAGNMVSKWTEPKNINLSTSQLWTKLNGVTSSDALRILTILGDWFQYFNNYNDAGTFGVDPNQINDQGEGSKKVVTSIGSTEANLMTDVIHATDVDDYGPFVIYPIHGRHIYIASNGDIYVTMSAKYGGTSEPVALYGKSTDGGVTWTWTRLNTANDNRQYQVNFAVDKNENIYFVWTEWVVPATTWDIKYCKLTTSTGSMSAVARVNYVITRHNYNPVVQANPDGEKMCVIWCGDGYGDDLDSGNIVLRTINADGSMEAVEVITTDGGAGADFYYNGCSMDFDSNGYRHIVAYTENSDLSHTNCRYIRETSGGFQAAVAINTELSDQNKLRNHSKILINKLDEAIIAYDIDNGTTSQPLYIRKIVNGVLGDRITVDSEVNWAVAQIQLDSANRIIVAYAANDGNYYYRILSASLEAVGIQRSIYKAPTGYIVSFFHIPWAIPPIINGISPNVIQQGVVMLAALAKSSDTTYANVNLIFTGNCVLGAPVQMSNMSKYTYNVRGSINRTKFNSGFNPSI